MADGHWSAIISAASGLGGAGLGFVASYLIQHVLPARAKKRALTMAVVSEMRRIKEVVEKHHTWWSERDKSDPRIAALPLYPFATPVYDKNIEHIGLLEPKLAAKYLESFGYLAWINAVIASRKEHAKHNLSGEFVATYSTALTSLSEQVAGFNALFKELGLAETAVGPAAPPSSPKPTGAAQTT